MKLFLLSLLVIISGCNFDPSQDQINLANDFVAIIQNHLDENFEGMSVNVVKARSLRNGYIVVQYTNSQGDQLNVAFNLDNFESGMNWEQINNLMDNGLMDQEIVTPYINQEGNIVENLYQDANGFLYEETFSSSKDLEKISAFIQNYNITKVGSAIAANYGLSEDRGISLAKTISYWNSIKAKREITNKDADYFFQEIAGLNFNELKNAFDAKIKGDSKKYNVLLDEAASLNQISPEHMNEIIDLFL